MRNMSFSKTTKQMYARTKTVTRRFGWWFLKPGDRLQAVEKSQGLKKYEKVKRICVIEVVSVQREQLREMTDEDCIREGFPDMGRTDFICMFVNSFRIKYCQEVNRIEFKYVDEDQE